jgi:polysaccharide export outer membrane protein
MGSEVEDGPTEAPYTLVRITPSLLENMNGVQATLTKKPAGAGPFKQSANEVYRLGPQDVLRIFVWGNPDLTPVMNTATGANVASSPAGRTINENGNLFFPMVGEIHASGMTISEFRAALTQRLSKYIKDPQIDVDVAGFRSQKVFISGEVKTPGIIPITDQPMRITDAIGLAGGLTQEADLYNLVLTRGKVSAPIDLNRIYYGGDTSANLLLQHGDILGVPDRQERKIFVLGEVGNANGVNQSRSYVMRRGRMSLAEVLSDAGGTNPFSAASNKVYVMRADENGDPIIYHLAARDPVSLVMADQFVMHPRDVVFVSPTDLTEIGRFIGQFFPLTSAVQTVKTTPF